MQAQEGDWEGFESFSEDIAKINSLKPSRSIQRQQTEPSPETPQEKVVTLHKKLTFRSKNRRKSSFVTPLNPNPKKNNSHVELPTTMPHKPAMADRVKRASLIFEKKEEGIPIFHEGDQRTIQGQLIYRCQPLSTAEEYLSRSSAKDICPVLNAQELRFEGRFESGNLQQVVRVNSEYHLYIAVDTNTRGHRQWFYFTVTAPQTAKVKMVVHSFKKKMSLFQIGMRPYGKMKDQDELAWRAVGSNVRYARDVEKGKRVQSRRPEYYLSFQIELQKDVEFCIASCIPYSYSFLQERLKIFTHPCANRVQIREEVLCRTLTGMLVPIITINEPAIARSHRYLIINARTHPGESSASWVLDGLLNELTSSSNLQALLIQFGIVVKVVPMLNVEGVCMGNYRTGTMGMDFNRLFLTGSPDLFPEINAVKRLVEECKARGRVDLFLDLHGHSILPGCFMYGPDPLFAPKTPLTQLLREMGRSRYFMRTHCVQGVDSAKAETSRIYFQVQEGVFALTCENSLGLYCKKGQKGKQVQFECKDWQEFGKELISVILNVYDECGAEEREKQKEREELEEALSLIRSAEEEEFAWEKSKTDNGKIDEALKQLNELQLEQIDLPRQLTLSQDHAPSQCPSLNDSDASSDDLSLQKQHELVKMVRKTLAKRTPAIELAPPPSLTASKQDPKATLSHSRGKFINNFKEIRFGVEDSTISDWYNRKRLFSIPRHLKQDRQGQGQSYLIRKKSHIATELSAEPAELTKRVRTEERELRRSSFDRFSNSQFMTRQKMLLENLLMRRT